jgi:hypothetical protein
VIFKYKYFHAIRVSFRLHQKRHLEEARERGAIDGEEDEAGRKGSPKNKKPPKAKAAATAATAATSLPRRASPAVSDIANAQVGLDPILRL